MASASSSGSGTARSLDTLLTQLLSPQRLRAYLLQNSRARYTLVAAIAALVAALAERKRRADNRDEVKRKVPHRRNSAVHLYDGNSFLVSLVDWKGHMRYSCPTKTVKQEL
jgi:hypothetical protein